MSEKRNAARGSAANGANATRAASNVLARHSTTRDALRQLAERAAIIARRSRHAETRAKFARLARFLQIEKTRSRYDV
ncbi:MAG: hypothetical protein HDKAJFGB_01823 [Anaerolineae bacterium]|nr:hypothetical protein [Anaerolineae bacterium]